MTLFDMNEIKTEHPKKLKSSACGLTEKNKRVAALGKRFEKCSEVIGILNKNQTIHYVSAGEWSTHDLLTHLLNITGPAQVMLASWSITADPIKSLIKLISENKITDLQCVFDWRVKIRCPEALALAKNVSAAVYLTSCHAKVTTIKNDDWSISIVGSANYTNNPRIESGVITESAEILHFHRTWITECINKADPFEFSK